MNHHQTVAAIARRLRHLKQRDVNEVLSILVELWSETLLQPEGYIRIRGMGKLYVEAQQLRSGGAVRHQMQRQHGHAPETLAHYYFRFRPTEAFRKRLVANRNPEEDQS